MTKISDQLRAAVYDALHEPKTVSELSEELGRQASSIRTAILDLKDEGVVIKYHRRKDRADLWVQSEANPFSKARWVDTTAGQLSLLTLAELYNDKATPLANVLSGALCYLWRNAFYSQLDKSQPENLSRAGVLDPYLHVRGVLQEVYSRALSQVQAIEHILMENTDLFTGQPFVLDAIGPVDRMKTEEIAKWFELWAVDFIEKRRIGKK